MKRSFAPVAAALSVVLFAAGQDAHAFATGGPSPAEIRQLNVEESIHRAVATAPDGVAQPGPYARYLMHLGIDEDEAMRQARTVDAGQLAATSRVASAHR